MPKLAPPFPKVDLPFNEPPKHIDCIRRCLPVVDEDALLEAPPFDIRGEVTRRRAEAIVAADAAGVPRHPLGQVVEELAQMDRARLMGGR